MIIKLIDKKPGHSSQKDRAKSLIQYIQNPFDTDANEKCYLTFSLNTLKSQERAEDFLTEANVYCLNLPQSARLFEHAVISWPENESPSEVEAKAIAEIFAKDINPYGPAFCGLHVNTENLHLHLAVIRYTPFGHPYPHAKNILYTLHARMYALEEQFGFSHSMNPVVIPVQQEQDEPSPELIPHPIPYIFSTKPRSVQYIQPKDENTLPLIQNFSPDFLDRIQSWYYLPDEEYPCLYESESYFVLLQWYRKELYDAIREQNAFLFNAKKMATLNTQEASIPPEDCLPKKEKEFLWPLKQNIAREYARLYAKTPKSVHPSIRAERVVRKLLQEGYAKKDIAAYFATHPQFERDKLQTIRNDRVLKSAGRVVNTFRELMHTNTRAVFSAQEKIKKHKREIERKKILEANERSVQDIRKRVQEEKQAINHIHLAERERFQFLANKNQDLIRLREKVRPNTYNNVRKLQTVRDIARQLRIQAIEREKRKPARFVFPQYRADERLLRAKIRAFAIDKAKQKKVLPKRDVKEKEYRLRIKERERMLDKKKRTLQDNEQTFSSPSF